MVPPVIPFYVLQSRLETTGFTVNGFLSHNPSVLSWPKTKMLRETRVRTSGNAWDPESIGTHYYCNIASECRPGLDETGAAS